jgi:hypothetical protein
MSDFVTTVLILLAAVGVIGVPYLHARTRRNGRRQLYRETAGLLLLELGVLALLAAAIFLRP